MDRASDKAVSEKPAGAGRSSVAFWVAVVAALIALMLAWVFLPVNEWVALFATWTRELGVAGVLAFAFVYVVAVTAVAPASILTLAAGIAYGAWGFPLVVISATVGATSAFLISRLIVRERVRRLARDRPFLLAVDQAIKDEGWQIVALMRLSPLIPFNLQNYFFGASQVGLVPYVAATFFGIMPGSAMYIYLGTLGHAAATGNLSGGPKIALLAAGLAASALVVAIVGRKARAKLLEKGISEEVRNAGPV